MVRKGGLEPPRSCDRQPLKLVRLPIPPLPRGRQIWVSPCHEAQCLYEAAVHYFLAGAAGAAGVVWVCVGAFCNTELEVPLDAQMASVIEVAMKMAPSTQVILARVVTAPRGPKAAWLEPPKAAAMSTFSPPCIKTTIQIKTHERTWSAVTAVIIRKSPSNSHSVPPDLKPTDNQ